MIDIDALSVSDAITLPVKMQWQLVHYWRDTGQFDRAEALIDANAQRTGPSITNLSERSRLALARGDAATAARLARERHGVSPTLSSITDLIRAELANGNPGDAQTLLAELRHLTPAEGSRDLIAAEVALASGDCERARSLYTSLLRTDAPPPTAYVGLARVALAEGDLAAAREALDILHAPPQPIDLRRSRDLADLWEQAGDIERSAWYATRARELQEELKRNIAAIVEPRVGWMADQEKNAVDFSAMPVETIDDQDAPLASDDVLAALQQTFGFSELRPGQAAVVSNVMAGKDTLAIMPTGSGKSLTFQLPALLLSGVTLVISPLIALMKDQVDSLPPPLRNRTRLINSTLSRDEMQRALDDLTSGNLKLVYVAPERLRDRAFLQALKRTNVALAVIDEAHCISLWGQDFRPDYLFIPRALKEMREPPVLAVTATATPDMARQIGVALGREMAVCRVSLFRPNLLYEVRNAGTREFKIREMIDICRQETGSGIVYVNSRKDTESFAALLRDSGVQAIHYHAGLDPDIRAASQDRFMSGQVRVVVATIAFGMGVDKANVRFIVHFNPPASLEAYAQESGRAGRDGQPAKCILLATSTDSTRLRTFVKQDVISREDLRTVYANLKRRAVGSWVLIDHFDADRLGGETDDKINSRVALGLLEQARLIARHPDMPRSITITRTPLAADSGSASPAWERLSSFLEFEPGQRMTTIDLIGATRALRMTPFEIDELLAARDDLILRDGPRLTCIELVDAGPDAGERVEKLLADVDALADRRIAQVIAYTRKQECRHRMLAAQFGERLPACQHSCDVCTGASQSPARSESKTKQPAPAGPDAALAVLDAVRTLPFPVGRTGLVRLVLGSAESTIKADRSTSFGALSGMKKGAVDKLVDRLIETGYLFRDMNHEYFLISLTDKGRRANREELAGVFFAPGRAQSGVPKAGGDTQIDTQLLHRLTEWRTERASADQVPPYVVAHNTMLEAVAAYRPSTLDELEQVPGFGRIKCERYGEEILAIVRNG
ncbi:MAG: RecQ family ATP-dependent DNA helicase [Thermomicrobiales bacterium]|nr:RecQ family ATP-dependent DNA helicase [Thermomicrobiales bacterium]